MCKLPRRLLLIIAFAALPATAHAGDPLLADLDEIPRWPVYAAIVVGLAIACQQAINHFRSRDSKARIFPKLSLRRRLYAPYSGGNHAKISFGSRDDA